MAETEPLPLTCMQARAIDEHASQRLHIPGIVLMENAGRGAAEIILSHYGGRGLHVVVCGGGNNGGDGYVIARHLCNAGVTVAVLSAVAPDQLRGDAQVNQHIIARMAIPVAVFDGANVQTSEALLEQATVIVDALLGTGFSGTVREPLASLIRSINRLGTQRPVVAIDVPSGLDCDTGMAADPTIRAERTITFVAPKVGFSLRDGPAHVGTLHVVGIGIAPCYVLPSN